MDRDRKSTGLKSLQGKIWEEGYRAGDLKGEVYPDVLPALERWRRAGIDIAIFSSGSVQAQRSLFRSTAEGDLTRFIRAYFDTTTGPKREPESYARIAAALESSPPKCSSSPISARSSMRPWRPGCGRRYACGRRGRSRGPGCTG